MGRPKPIATVDCETDPFKFGRVPKPFFWNVYDGTRHYNFETVSDVIHFLRDKKWIVYAHNGGKFDYHMPGFLEAMEPGSKIMIINGRLARFKIGECEFRDSCNILPIALKDYAKDEIEYEWFERGVRDSHMVEIKKYCEMDCKYLYDLVKKFRDSYGGALTLAGAAMNQWRTKFKGPVPKSTEAFYHQVAPFYYGGRVEAFTRGVINEPFHLYDINSAYPRAMLESHPITPACTMVALTGREKIIRHSLYAVSADSGGAFPSRGKGGLEFVPSGHGRFTITGWELQAAIDTKTAKGIQIHSRLDFAKTVNFKKYVDWFYEMKKASQKNSPEYIFAKLFMNSLYGKFGANPDNYKHYMIDDMEWVPALKEMGMKFGGELGKWAIMESPLEKDEKRYFNAATAASITGWVRAYLWRNICAIRASGGRVLYCDTDSIAFVGKVPAGMKVGKELGEWSSEGEFDFAAIAGKKLYAFRRKAGTFTKPEDEWKTACKGVRLSPSEIVEIARGKTIKYQKEAPSFGIKMVGKASENGERRLQKHVGWIERNVSIT